MPIVPFLACLFGSGTKVSFGSASFFCFVGCICLSWSLFCEEQSPTFLIMRVPHFSLLLSFSAASVLAQGDPLGEIIYVRAEDGAGSASRTTLTASATSIRLSTTSASESTSAPGSIPAAAIYNSSASNSSGIAHSPINTNASTGLIFGGLYLDEPGLPQAEQPTDSVPADGVTYTPNGTDFDVKDFNKWSHDQYFVQKKRFMVVKAGTYNYMSAEDEFNKMMSFWLYDGATLDLRGCT